MRVKKSGLLRIWWRRAVHLGFGLLYNEMAWSYDVVSWLVSLGEWRKWQAAALPFVQGNRILEIAHGTGHMLKALARDDRHVTGVDMSRAMGRIAARRIRGIERPVPLVRSRAQVLPFRSGAFDTVFCTFPTNFIAEKETMESICRVLQPGGRYLIVPEGRLTGTGPVERLIAWLFTITGQRDDMFSVNEDAHQPEDSPRLRAFRRNMERTGFTISVHHAALARSSATVIIATRAAS